MVFALAGIVAGVAGVASALASDNADPHAFMAGERLRREQAKQEHTRQEQTAAVEKDGASRGKKALKMRAKRTIVAPPAFAAAGEAASGRASGGRPLGYRQGAREQYRALIAAHAVANGVPFALGDAVVRVESRYQPRVTNGGAIGLMQIKHATARGLGYRGDAKGLMEPETNIRYGMKYLGQAYRLAGGDTCGAVMRYQSGHYAKRPSRANLAYCAKVRTIVASADRENRGGKLKTASAATGAGAIMVD
ncbi:MAG: lytic transglycosylase domain-containing protein [Pseudochelatococcus sp.]|jgi:soluble lytic murein transglycosylase-like protein|uniref:lytic transglycosylase domain-containing protein n=1 Tax=Pseudochelatococcus sp. TaxID=2020869 RepID=UPI003D94915C